MRKRVMFQAIAIADRRPAAADGRAALRRCPGPAQQDLHPHRRRRRDRARRRLARCPRPTRAWPRSATSTRPTARSAWPCSTSSDEADAGDARAASRTSCSISAPISPRPARISRPRRWCCASCPSRSTRLEREIDAMNEELEPLRSFILPGGGAGAAPSPPRPRHRAAGRARRGRGRRAGVAQPARARLSQPAVGPSVRARASAGARSRRRGRALAAGRDARRLTYRLQLFGVGARADGDPGNGPPGRRAWPTAMRPCAR